MFEFDGSPINDCFVYLVAVLSALVDRFVPVSSQTPLPVGMKGSLHCLAREKATRWKVYKEVRREFSRNHELEMAALDAFNGVNYVYRNFVRSNQYHYESYESS